MVVRSFRGASLPLLESRKLSDLRVKPLGYIPPTKTPQLSMIEIDQQKLLIANGPNGVQLLTSLPASRMTQTATWRDDSEKQRLVEELRKQIRQRIHQDAYWSKKT